MSTRAIVWLNQKKISFEVGGKNGSRFTVVLDDWLASLSGEKGTVKLFDVVGWQ